MTLKRAIVVNCSAPHYNLGAAKLANWLRAQGYSVVEGGEQDVSGTFDLVCLSVIFSEHARRARRIALATKHRAEVWCGGPGIWALAKWWKRETGLDCTLGVDPRFDQQPGEYLHTFGSRGCPVNCWFCNVPTYEGREFTLIPDFHLAPILCDSNLSALPVDYQEHIINRYESAGYALKDANSGFEPKTFDEGTFRRWKPLLDKTLAYWRFAFDEMKEKEEVGRVFDILKGVPSYRKRVYVLVGNEPIGQCYERLMYVKARGGEPHCQYVRPLNWLGGRLWERYDWTNQLGVDFCRFVNTHLWRNTDIWDYRPRKDGKAPFWFLRPSI